MTDGKHPNQAMGSKDRDATAPTIARPDEPLGESGGGAYPNPHTGKEPGGFHGGQSGQAYHGPQQLGETKIEDQPNAGSTDD